MRLTRGVTLSVAVLAVSLIMTSVMPRVAHAAGTTLYWCNTAGTGTLNFNTASNWNTSNTCTGGTSQVPAAGNNLVFDVTNLTGNETINNDISGLSIGSLTFQGTSANGYLYTVGSTAGNTLTVTGGITNSVPGSPIGGTTLSLNVVVSGSQTFSDPAGGLTFGSFNTLTIGNGTTLTISNAGGLGTNLPILVGSGTISDTATDGPVGFAGSSPNFTGTISAASGAEVVAFASQALGAASATTVIASGASLGVSFFTAGITLPENITLAGTGTTGPYGYGATIVTDPPYGAAGGAPSSPLTATLSGNIVLQSDVTVKPNTNANLLISGPLSGNYTMTAIAGSGGTLTINSSNNTSKTPNTSTSSAKAPGTPNTGVALAAANPVTVLGASLVAATTLIGLALVNGRKATSAKKRS